MSCQARTRLHPNIESISLRTEPQVVVISGEIDEGVASQFAQQMDLAQETGQHVLPIVIHSHGGCVYSLMYMMNIIRQSTLPIATIVPARAASAAVDLFLSAPKHLRFMAPDARLNIHSACTELAGTMNAAAMKSEGKELKHIDDRLWDIMEENCGLQRGFFKKLLRKRENADVWIDCKKAIAMGLVAEENTELPRLVMEVNPGFSFETASGRSLATSPPASQLPVPARCSPSTDDWIATLSHKAGMTPHESTGKVEQNHTPGGHSPGCECIVISHSSSSSSLQSLPASPVNRVPDLDSDGEDKNSKGDTDGVATKPMPSVPIARRRPRRRFSVRQPQANND